MTTEVEGEAETSPGEGQAGPGSEEFANAQTAEFVNSAVAALQGLCERQPTAPQDLDRILEEHLRQPLTTEWAGALLDSLGMYADEEVANTLLTALVQGAGDPAFRAALETAADEQTRSWVRLLLARYGLRLREGWILAGENPEAWRAVNRTVLFDVNSEAWAVNFEIIKYSGEKMKLEETPSSLLLLATAIVDTLLRLPKELAPAALDAGKRSDFVDKVVEFMDLFAPEASQGPDETAATSAGDS